MRTGWWIREKMYRAAAEGQEESPLEFADDEQLATKFLL
jgi:hypothetical protein